MTKSEVIEMLEKHSDPRGKAHWVKTGDLTMNSYGIGLTILKKLSKPMGKDHQLALELWDENNYECRIMATLIDDPKQVTREQIDRQVADVDFWMLSYSYCSNLLPKVPFIPALAEEWMNSVDHLKRRCGFALLYQIARDNKKLPDTYFIPFIGRIEKELQGEENFVKDAMNAALFAIGKRSEELNTLALEAAKRIGKVTVDYGDNSCQALDVVAHLTSDRKRKNYNE